MVKKNKDVSKIQKAKIKILRRVKRCTNLEEVKMKIYGRNEAVEKILKHCLT